MDKRVKARRKRWLKSREKAHQRDQYRKAFRDYFVKKGILSA